MRLPVAAKMALHSAGPTGGTPGSPTPLGIEPDQYDLIQSRSVPQRLAGRVHWPSHHRWSSCGKVRQSDDLARLVATCIDEQVPLGGTCHPRS